MTGFVKPNNQVVSELGSGREQANQAVSRHADPQLEQVRMVPRGSAELKHRHPPIVFIKANSAIMNKFHFQLDLLLYLSR